MKIIIISGPTGSGKTTLSKKILNKFESGVLLSTDNYYKNGIISKFLSRFIENYFDRKLSFNYKNFKNDFNFICKNRKSNHEYFYDFKNKNIKKYEHKKINIKFLIVEGIFTNELLNNFNKENFFFIELKTNKNSCLKRVIKRDVNERGKSKLVAKNDFLKSWSFYQSKNKFKNSKNKNKFIISKRSDLDLALKKIFNL